MLKIFHKRRPKSTESGFLFRLSIPLLIAGGSATALGIRRLLSEESFPGGLGPALGISVGMLIFGIWGLIHSWRLDRKQQDGSEI